MATAFVGRVLELDRLFELVATSPIVQVSGLRGIGKTRLVREACWRRQCESGCRIYLNLRSDERELTQQDFIEVLNFRNQNCPACAKNQFWLIIDDAEKADSRITWAVSKSEQFPWIRVILMSETLFFQSHIVHFPLGPVDEDLELLNEASAVLRPVSLGSQPHKHDDPGLGELLDLCAGIPLLLEEAARLNLEQDLSHLVNEVELWSTDNSACSSKTPCAQSSWPPLAQTIALIVDSAISYLDPTTHTVWLALAELQHPFSRDQVALIVQRLGINSGGQELLQLIECGLVQSWETASDIRRFWMPIPWRLRARRLNREDHAAIKNLPSKILTVMNQWWFQRVAHLEATWFGPHQKTAFTELDTDMFALQPTLNSLGNSTDALRIATGLWPYWTVSGRPREAVSLIEGLLETSSAHEADRDNALWAAAWLALCCEDIVASRQFAARMSLPQDLAAQARKQQIDGLADIYAGDMQSAYRRLKGASQFHLIAEESGDLALDLSFLAIAASTLRLDEEAQKICIQAMAVSDALEETWIKGYTMWAYSLVQWRRGHYEEAAKLAADGVRSGFLMRDRLAALVCLSVVAWYAADCDQTEAAAMYLGAAEALFESTGMPTVILGTEGFHQTAVKRIREEVDEAKFQEYRDAGKRRTLEELSVEVDETLMTIDILRDKMQEARLTPRQLEIAGQVAAGRANKQIAQTLGISTSTVETHLDKIFRKLHFTSRAQLAGWYVKNASLLGSSESN